MKPIRKWRRKNEQQSDSQETDRSTDSKATDADSSKGQTDRSLVSELKSSFCYPQNQDFVVRELEIRPLGRSGTLLFLAGAANTKKVEQEILHSLLGPDVPVTGEDIIDTLIKRILTVGSASRITGSEKIIDEILFGNAVLLIDGCKEGISIGAAGFEHRSVDKPQSETTLKGPLEAFVESVGINRSLIRKQLRSSTLVSETVMVGETGQSEVTLMYLHDIAAPELVEDVKKRIQEIKVDIVQTLGILEQHIEDRPYSLVPTVLFTERPDRAVGFLREGHVVMLMDASPICLVVPATFWSFFHTSEDYYQRWPFANFIRLIRIVAVFVALLTPSLYIAVTNYHAEMLPTDLLLAIAATRERVPFPALVEVLVMEGAFELLREAGVRIPTPIGPTIGIVGALILGQAAVDANVVSPILVIVVSITGLASFAVPNISFNFMIRIARFILLLFAAAMGFFGITIFLTAAIAYLTTVKSFDVPFLAPKAPQERSSTDFIYRSPIWKQWLRPQHLRPQQSVRQKKKPRG